MIKQRIEDAILLMEAWQEDNERMGRGDYYQQGENGEAIGKAYKKRKAQLDTILAALQTLLELERDDGMPETFVHLGNPRLIKIKGLKIVEMPDCEGGGYAITGDVANKIKALVDQPNHILKLIEEKMDETI